jgi:hypothetical protein
LSGAEKEETSPGAPPAAVRRICVPLDVPKGVVEKRGVKETPGMLMGVKCSVP